MIDLYTKDGTTISIDPKTITEIKSVGNGSEVHYDDKTVRVYEVPSRIQSIIARSENAN